MKNKRKKEKREILDIGIVEGGFEKKKYWRGRVLLIHIQD